MNKHEIYESLIVDLGLSKEGLSDSLRKALGILATVISDENFKDFPYLDDVTLSALRRTYSIRVEDRVKNWCRFGGVYADLYGRLNGINYYLMMMTNPCFSDLSEDEIIKYVYDNSDVKTKAYVALLEKLKFRYYELTPVVIESLDLILDNLIDDSKKRLLPFDEVQFMILRELLGINSENKRKTLDEISEEKGLSKNNLENKISCSKIRENVLFISNLISESKSLNLPVEELFGDLIENLNLSKRNTDMLKRRNITKISDLIKLSSIEVGELKGSSVSCYMNIKRQFDALGLALAPEPIKIRTYKKSKNK